MSKLQGKHRLQVGDKIIVVKECDYYDCYKGAVGVIIEVGDTNTLYKVTFDDLKSEWCYGDDIKLYEEQPKVAETVVTETPTTTDDVSTITLTEEALKEQPLTDFGYTTKQYPNEITIGTDGFIKTKFLQESFVGGVYKSKGETHYRVLGMDLGVDSSLDYLELYNKLSTKQYKKLEKVALKLDEIGGKIGADYHEMLELLKRHF